MQLEPWNCSLWRTTVFRVVLRRELFQSPYCTHWAMRREQFQSPYYTHWAMQQVIGACPHLNCATEHSEQYSHCSEVVRCRQLDRDTWYSWNPGTVPFGEENICIRVVLQRTVPKSLLHPLGYATTCGLPSFELMCNRKPLF
jgi:hypothetical protein